MNVNTVQDLDEPVCSVMLPCKVEHLREKEFIGSDTWCTGIYWVVIESTVIKGELDLHGIADTERFVNRKLASPTDPTSVELVFVEKIIKQNSRVIGILPPEQLMDLEMKESILEVTLRNEENG